MIVSVLRDVPRFICWLVIAAFAQGRPSQIDASLLLALLYYSRHGIHMFNVEPIYLIWKPQQIFLTQDIFIGNQMGGSLSLRGFVVSDPSNIFLNGSSTSK